LDDDDDDSGNNHFLLRDVMYDADRFFCGKCGIERKKEKLGKQLCCFYFLFREKVVSPSTTSRVFLFCLCKLI
jgi:hypothetical protein